MQYIEQHKKHCLELLERAREHMAAAKVSPTYMCRKAGVQIHALGVLEKGTATPETMQRLSDYLADQEATLDAGAT
ncbi:hypothetical protein GCM10007385_35210 [Tateyamaria omphalii]|uniref:hypothetical protein n=1 Tax=Tateyamaria omphalii TaxID=299262 RepID=UPI001676D814|nr:hypothetical protein [Tateyamaria omphalii]GGX63040.1 hypothetical protein GCM10007385_35210 [Tateyamaria omphalii]